MSKPRHRTNGDINKLDQEDRPAHGWYRFVLSFPPHLVRDYLERFGLSQQQRVLDPFCGTGTVLVECKKLGIPSIGVEANPMAHFATSVKVDWSPEPEGLRRHAASVAVEVASDLSVDGLEDDPLQPYAKVPDFPMRKLSQEKEQLLLSGSISPLPLHKTLLLLERLERAYDERYYYHELLALAKVVVFSASNLHFGPEVGVSSAKTDAPVIATWLREVQTISSDLCNLRRLKGVPATVRHADSRRLLDVLEPASVDAVITSPPYPNEKDYTRTTRLESVLLGLISDKEDLRVLKRRMVRSNTRGVYKGDDDDAWIRDNDAIQRIASDIESKRVALGKTSGFERLYGRVTKLYFGGMSRHLAGLRPVLRPGAQLAYVVGDQASYLQVMIRTGQLLAQIAESLGYEVIDIALFRTRLATATRQQLREEVVVLRWPGP